MRGWGGPDSGGSVIDNCTGFESPDLETGTGAEGEGETGRRRGWGIARTHECALVCAGSVSEPVTGDQFGEGW